MLTLDHLEIRLLLFQVQFGTNQSHFGNKEIHNEIAKFRIGRSKFERKFRMGHGKFKMVKSNLN